MNKKNGKLLYLVLRFERSVVCRCLDVATYVLKIVWLDIIFVEIPVVW